MQDSLMFWGFVALCTFGILLLIGEVLGLVDVAIQMVAELFV